MIKHVSKIRFKSQRWEQTRVKVSKQGRSVRMAPVVEPGRFTGRESRTNVWHHKHHTDCVTLHSKHHHHHKHQQREQTPTTINTKKRKTMHSCISININNCLREQIRYFFYKCVWIKSMDSENQRDSVKMQSFCKNARFRTISCRALKVKNRVFSGNLWKVLPMTIKTTLWSL